MGLLTKTTLYFLSAMMILLLAAGFFLFHQFNRELTHRMDQELVTEEIQWIRYLRTQAELGNTFILKTPEILIYPIDGSVTKYPTIETTTGFDAKGNRRLPFRQLTHIVEVADISYLITIRKSQEQRSMLVGNIARITLLVFVALLATTLLVNWLISRSIWRPFRRSLQKICSAELQKMEAVHFETSNIKEFNDLNTALNEMAGKIHSDYMSMKEFTENAAHEMQTPIAVVNSKLELLLQDSNLKDEQVESIMQATTALSRLGKLNQSLLLLAKIENNQFETKETISLKEITTRFLRLFDEVIKEKQLTVHLDCTENFLLQLHPLLADTLVSNLIGNAIKYNYTGGSVNIAIDSRKYQISNTSTSPPISPQQLFKRFNKSAGNLDTSNGLGLAIVKKIVDAHNLAITYSSENDVHYFSITKI